FLAVAGRAGGRALPDGVGHAAGRGFGRLGLGLGEGSGEYKAAQRPAHEATQGAGRELVSSRGGFTNGPHARASARAGQPQEGRSTPRLRSQPASTLRSQRLMSAISSMHTLWGIAYSCHSIG